MDTIGQKHKSSRKGNIMKKITVLLICLVLLMSACATAKRMNSLSLGMTKQEVIAIMGNPISTSANEGKEYYRYFLSERGLDETGYFVRFVNGKVNAYGKMGDFGIASTAESRSKIDIDLKHQDMNKIKSTE
jgi:hypothetical protein